MLTMLINTLRETFSYDCDNEADQKSKYLSSRFNGTIQSLAIAYLLGNDQFSFEMPESNKTYLYPY